MEFGFLLIKSVMKQLNLLLWVGQFGFSAIFPTVFYLYLAVWLQNKYDLGAWILILLGILGVLTSLRTTRSCLRSMRKAAEEITGDAPPPVSFNDHK